MLKKIVLTAAVGVSVLSIGRVALSGDPECCRPKAVKVPGFAKLKALEGEWRAKLPDGKSEAKVSWSVVSAGTALMETHKTPDGGSMVTLYHADGDHIALTHFCGLGNQPRMKAAKVADEEIVFEFRGATNLKEGEAHMHALTIRFKDADHVSEEWTLQSKEGSTKHAFDWERVKN